VTNLYDALLFLKTTFSSGFLWLAFLFIALIFIIWSTILSKIDLSVAVPVASFSYILVPLASIIFLHEKIDMLRWFGIIFILMGIIFVSMSSKEKVADR
jgi:undecaprenyl phosphate-alpha-L-ara4N flippase subunit ArnE